MKVKEESEKAGSKLNIQKTNYHSIQSHHFTQIDGKQSGLFLGLQNHCGSRLQSWNWKMLAPWKKSYDKYRQYIKKQRHHFANKGLSSQSYSFSSSHVWMWRLDHKDSWASKNWCFWTVVLEKTLESPLDCKEIQPVNPKGDQSWIFIGRTDAEAEAPILWPPDAKNWLVGKDPDAGKDWRWEEKGTTVDEMVGWHHWLNGCEFEQLGEMVKDREAWLAAVHVVVKSWMWLCNWTVTANLVIYRDWKNTSKSLWLPPFLESLPWSLFSEWLRRVCSESPPTSGCRRHRAAQRAR